MKGLTLILQFPNFLTLNWSSIHQCCHIHVFGELLHYGVIFEAMSNVPLNPAIPFEYPISSKRFSSNLLIKSWIVLVKGPIAPNARYDTMAASRVSLGSQQEKLTNTI